MYFYFLNKKDKLISQSVSLHLFWIQYRNIPAVWKETQCHALVTSC